MKLAKFHISLLPTQARFLTTDLTPEQLFSLTFFEGDFTFL